MYAHDVLFESRPDELVKVAVPFLSAALEAGEPAVTVCRPARAEQIYDALGPVTGLLQLNHGEVYQPPARALTAFLELMESDGAAAAPRVRMVTDVADADSPWHQAEWIRLEAVLDRALAAYPLWVLCVYDPVGLPEPLLRAGEAVHPTLFNGGGRRRNDAYTDPVRVLRATAGAVVDPLEADPPVLDTVDPPDLHTLRRRTGEALESAELPARRRQDLVAAVSEVATNALLHGRPPVRVRAWTMTGRALVTVRDGGEGFDDPYLGYLPPRTGHSEGGMGLWMARQLCDHLDASRDDEGFVVRLTSLG
jgi:anti-sigma regulatory factor (Ser/Thr protein kinase)